LSDDNDNGDQEEEEEEEEEEAFLKRIVGGRLSEVNSKIVMTRASRRPASSKRFNAGVGGQGDLSKSTEMRPFFAVAQPGTSFESRRTTVH